MLWSTWDFSGEAQDIIRSCGLIGRLRHGWAISSLHELETYSSIFSAMVVCLNYLCSVSQSSSTILTSSYFASMFDEITFLINTEGRCNPVSFSYQTVLGAWKLSSAPAAMSLVVFLCDRLIDSGFVRCPPAGWDRGTSRGIPLLMCWSIWIGLLSSREATLHTWNPVG